MPHEVTAPTENGVKTAVLLCGDLAKPGMGLNLEGLRSSIEATLPNTGVEVVPDLCDHLGQLSPAIVRQGAVRAVLGLCSQDYSQVELQVRARKAGLEPFGVEVLPLGTLCARVHDSPQAAWKAQVLLSAAVARARAFRESGPEHARLHFLPHHQKVSRRHLFTLPPFGYRPVPGIRTEACAAGAGCRLCARACPRQAFEITGGHPTLDKSRCEGCGVCLTACPRDVIEFPGWSLAQFDAQLGALVDSASLAAEPLGLLLTCQRAVGKLEELARQGSSYSHQWLPVLVPCLGMVTPSWILQGLARGAEAVALLPCAARCPFGQGQSIEGRVDFCQRLLPLLGQESGRVRLLSASHPEQLLQALQEPPQRGGSRSTSLDGPLRLGTPEETFRALQHLASPGGSYGVTLENPHSPFGVVELRAEACTGCLACVEACPTRALVAERDTGGLTLAFVPSSCVACGMCIDSCPQVTAQTLRLRRVTDMDVLGRGRMVLRQDELARCESCGAVIASRALLQHVGAQLGESSQALSTALNQYCPSCRLTFAWGAAPSPAPQEDG
jgi:ferredoxin